MARRRRRSIGTALAVLAVSAGASTAYAAWSATTGPPAASFASLPDWTVPTASPVAIQKGGATTAGYANGYVKPGGQYYVYSQVAADTGNPASGIASPGGVAANLVNITSGQSAAALTSGSFASMGTSYNYRAGPFTVSAAAGNALYTVTTKDTAGNLAVTPNQTVVVDGTAPTGTDVQANRVGGTAGKAEAGDKLVFTFSEPIDPDSLVSGWDGTSRNITLRIVNGGGAADTIELWDGATKIAAMGTVTLPAKNYVTATVDFTSSPMVLSGSTLTVTLGSTTGGASVGAGTAGAIKWVPTATLYDRAGNKLVSSTVTETGAPADAEF
ncbi:MAG: hypothetical protein QOF37_2307 [Thermoleophilaceae bacterium]|jgi:hypothetical protein|nr:hypothetical protein [Thermoleophilaceae bacterium]